MAIGQFLAKDLVLNNSNLAAYVPFIVVFSGEYRINRGTNVPYMYLWQIAIIPFSIGARMSPVCTLSHLPEPAHSVSIGARMSPVCTR